MVWVVLLKNTAMSTVLCSNRMIIDHQVALPIGGYKNLNWLMITLIVLFTCKRVSWEVKPLNIPSLLPLRQSKYSNPANSSRRECFRSFDVCDFCKKIKRKFVKIITINRSYYTILKIDFNNQFAFQRHISVINV